MSPRAVALFLDRDGVLNEKAPEGAYVTSPDELLVLPGVGRALATLRSQVPGLHIAVVTNQRGVARGRLSLDALEAIHDRLAVELARDGATIDRIEVCPHEGDACACRKPGIGLFERALSAWPSVHRARSAVVGDSAIDIIAGGRIGARTYLVGEPGRRAQEAEAAHDAGVAPDEQGDSLPGLVDDRRLISWLRDGRA